MFKRTIAWLMILAAAISLYGCGSEKASESGVTEGDMTAPETAAETVWLDTLPDTLNYGAENYSILYAQQITQLGENEVTYPLDSITGGDIVAEAVYAMTKKCEEFLNIKIVSEQIDYITLNNVLATSAMSDSHDFESVCGRLSNMAETVPND